jgi:hypothetical protein
MLVKVLRFVPSRDRLKSVSLVNGMLKCAVDDRSLWNHVHFNFSDSPDYLTALLTSRFNDSVHSVRLDSKGGSLPAKIGALKKSKVALEEVVLVTAGRAFIGLRDVILGLGESLKTLSHSTVGHRRDLVRFRLQHPGVEALPTSNLVSLDLFSCARDFDDHALEAVVACCQKLELLRIGYTEFEPGYTSR